MPHTEVDGIRLYYEVTGDGPAVMFVHEFGGDLRSWEPQVRYLSRFFTCITFNARGYPPSDVPDDPAAYSQEIFTCDIAAVLGALRIGQAHVVGLSMGSVSALDFAIRFPAMARSIVLCGCGYGSVPEQRPAWLAGNAAMAEAIEDNSAATAERYAAGATRVQYREKDPRGWGEFLAGLKSLDPKGAALTLKGVQASRPSLFDLEEELKALSMPVLVVVGDEDEPALEPALFLKRRIRRAGLCVFPKAGHAINAEDPALFNQSLLAFFTAVDDTLWAVVTHVAGALRCRALVLMPDADDTLDIVSGFPPEDHLDAEDRTAAQRAWTQGRAAGWAEPDSETGAWLFIPMRTASSLIGLLGVSFEDQRTQLSPEHRRLLDAVVDQAAVAVERTKLTVDIEEARILSETEQLRSALLSSVSHDLRTPLVSILGSATSLANLGDAIPPQDRSELAQTILEESERLNRFVQNLLDMTRLGYGALEPKRDWIDLRDVIGGAVRDMRRSLEDLKVELRFVADLPLMYVDPVLIGQVVMNLLDNAAKHAPLNSVVTVSAARRGEDIAISVTDSGPGIPPGDRGAVFDMFYRVAVRDSDARGTGLGLAICKGLVEAHGGEIAARAGLDGIGTEMTFTLPLREVPPILDAQDVEA